MKVKILESRHFVSPYAKATERTVKDYEIDIECSKNRIYTYNGITQVLSYGDILVRTPGGTVSSIGAQESYILTLDLSTREQPAVYSRNIQGDIQPQTDNELITQLPSIIHTRNPSMLLDIYIKLSSITDLSSTEADELVNEIVFILNAECAHARYKSIKPRETISEKVISYMENHISDELTLDDIATDLHFNKSHIVRAFKKETGKTPIASLIEMRLDRASDLVAITDMKISDIAFSVGYKTVSFFIAEYKKRFGVTPEAQRRASRFYSSLKKYE